jgi:hypothetical protein
MDDEIVVRIKADGVTIIIPQYVIVEEGAPVGQGAPCGAQSDYWFRLNPERGYAPTFPLYWIA